MNYLLALVQTTPPPEVKIKADEIHTFTSGEAFKPQPAYILAKIEKGLLRTRMPALVLALIVVMVLSDLLIWRQLNLANRQASTSMQLVALANTQNSPGAVGTMIMDPNGKYGTLVVDNLATLDPSKQYQVWLIKGGERTSGGVFSVNPDGYASLELHAASPLAQFDSIGITIEPTGGSPGPTGAKVLGGDLPH